MNILYYIVNCFGGTLAYASNCMLDISDNNRPVAGYINICPSVSILCKTKNIMISYMLKECL